VKIFLQEKAVEATKQKEEKRGKKQPKPEEQACHSVGTALMQSVAPSVSNFITKSNPHNSYRHVRARTEDTT
jgi:uncharacterized FlgJ-related protein